VTGPVDPHRAKQMTVNLGGIKNDSACSIIAWEKA
jgi:hypothetical protein